MSGERHEEVEEEERTSGRSRAWSILWRMRPSDVPMTHTPPQMYRAVRMSRPSLGVYTVTDDPLWVSTIGLLGEMSP